MWYDLAPTEYAKGLEWNATRCDEQAARHRADSKAWAPYEARRAERNANRLRAMARLCVMTTEDRAGGVDFLGMSCPSQTVAQEAVAIATVDAMAARAPFTPLPR